MPKPIPRDRSGGAESPSPSDCYYDAYQAIHQSGRALSRAIWATYFVVPKDSFLFRMRNKQEMANYNQGFKAGSDSKEQDEDKSFAWQRGWAEAQE
jgi:hypothetical protein